MGRMSEANLNPSERVRGDARFDEIRRSGARMGDSLLFIRALENGLERSRLGLAVSKSAGNAVIRARLRRMFREAFRLNKKRLPRGLDILLSPRRGAAEAKLEALSQSLVELAGRVAKRLKAGGKE